MIDSHCHLDHCADPNAATDPSLRAMVSIGTTVERCRETLRLAERFDNVWAAVGIHPTEANDAQDPEVRSAIAELAEHPKVVAIGETGVDYYWDATSAKVQRDSFRWQAELAAELDKPLILHVRDKKKQEGASRDAAAWISEAGWSKGILHCFNGHARLGEVGLELGWFVSFAGNLTYKNAPELHAAAREIPHDRLLVETDSPFLTPVPKRGERNVPANVRHTAAFLAELRGDTVGEVEAYTDDNAIRVYSLPLS